METQKMERQNIQKMKYGNTKDGNIFTSSAPLIYGDYYTKLRGRTLTKCNICFYSPFTINANRTTISSVEKCARSYLSLWPFSQTCKNGFIQYINRFLYIDYVCVSCLNPPSSWKNWKSSKAKTRRHVSN